MTEKNYPTRMHEVPGDDWISVKDRLPEVWQDVLLVCNGKVYEGCMMNDGDFENARGNDLTNVTHWMPLPEPPGEEGEG